jgi:hypothetical protein
MSDANAGTLVALAYAKAKCRGTGLLEVRDLCKARRHSCAGVIVRGPDFEPTSGCYHGWPWRAMRLGLTTATECDLTPTPIALGDMPYRPRDGTSHPTLGLPADNDHSNRSRTGFGAQLEGSTR